MERFSYYGMRALLVLYIYSSIEDGGLGWTKKEALALYGIYTMLVYVMSIPGGILADKMLGQKKTVMLGGFLLCVGHGVLAVPAMWAFYLGLGLIILGVGCLKPNISTMVGGLYKKGDPQRDKGFTIFYIGINIGALLAGIIVGTIGEKIGWHYGFGLAGIGMVIGQLVFMSGQKHLEGVGEYLGNSSAADKALMSKPLTKIEKDRVIVLLISFLIIILFWGAFEQAGGLLNLYADEKINLALPLIDATLPASVFQSVNALFIIVFGTSVAAYWVNRKRKGKEVSSIFKMAVGTIIMGFGFLLMAGASWQASSVDYGKASMFWLIGAYLLHTIGELCASPVALSFITKLSPVKYASIMMGVYFAATGFGNYLASKIGEAAQAETINIELVAPLSNVAPFVSDSLIYKDKKFGLRAELYRNNAGEIVLNNYNSTAQDFSSFINFSKGEGDEKGAADILNGLLAEMKPTKEQPLHATLKLEKDVEAKKVKSNIGDGKNYAGELIIEEVQNKREFNIFVFITLLTTAVGLLVILFLKKLKALTHGAEEEEEDTNDEAEGFELA